MSQGTMCLTCRLYINPADKEWGCKCATPVPSDDGVRPNDLTMFLCKLDKSKCDHEWNNDGCNPTHCLKCGQSFTAYTFMEAP